MISRSYSEGNIVKEENTSVVDLKSNLTGIIFLLWLNDVVCRYGGMAKQIFYHGERG